MSDYQDVFISYGRVDSRDFAAKLSDRLTAAGLQTWFDFNDIPFGVDYQKQIDGGIEQSDNFVFIIAPHSINSAYCSLEVELAVKYRKRIIPLLHVEAISYATWQQRHPDGTETEWQAYCAAGKHSSFTNMPPELSKINWIYLRDGVDDYAAGCRNLLELIERDRDYVHTHTWLLDRALIWERHQKQTQYLLIGRDREQAESWLHQPFSDRQPPCEPTDLHCEYIVESLKNAQNLMTRVFLAYISSDQLRADELRRVLQRQGITVWHDGADIQASADVSQAVRTGIEQADNIVMVVSPESVQSAHCQEATAIALELHKRLIPVMVNAVAPTDLPDHLQGWQAIDLTAPSESDSHQAGLDQLLKTVATDATYHNEHKQLLVKALKWQRQQQNPAHLLRGYNLRHAETWLKVARDRPQSAPTLLHIQFIETSLQQPPVGSLDVFISYSRTDSDFARKLNETLQEQGKTTWFDQESIASGSDFQQEIHRGIEVANHFLFVLSPESVNSPYCDDEVTYAESLGKRVLTVLCRDVDPKDLHRVLRPVQWIDFRPDAAEFDASFRELVRVLESDRDHLAAHTQLSLKALEWQTKQRNDSLLLRGTELDTAAIWLTDAEQKSPPPTALQREYLQISRATYRADQRRRQILRGALAIAGGIIVASLGFSYRTIQQAQSGLAETIQALNLAGDRVYDLDPSDPENLINSLKSASYLDQLWGFRSDTSALNAQVLGNLIRDHHAIPITHILTGHQDGVQTVAFNRNGDLIATGDADGELRLWTPDGQPVAHWYATNFAILTDLAFSPDGQWLVTTAWDKTAKIWAITPLSTATPPKPQAVLTGHDDVVYSVDVSPDGQQIATASLDGTAKLWNQEGTEVATLDDHTDQVIDVTYSPQGEWLATASNDGTARLWDAEGTSRQVLPSVDGGTVFAVAFHPTQPLLAAANQSGSVQLWYTDGSLRTTISISSEDADADLELRDVRFSNTGNVLAVASTDGQVRLFDLDGNFLMTYQADDHINKLSFAPDDSFIAAASRDQTIRLWSIEKTVFRERNEMYTLAVHPSEDTFAVVGDQGLVSIWHRSSRKVEIPGFAGTVQAVDIAEDGTIAIAGTADFNESTLNRAPRGIKLLDAEGRLLQEFFTDPAGFISDLKFSPDGQIIATVDFDGQLILWNRDGQPQMNITSTQPITRVNWLADGTRLLTAEEGGRIKIVDTTGAVKAEWVAHDGNVHNAVVSPDGQSIATAGQEGLVKIWSMTGERLQTLQNFAPAVQGSHRGVWGLAFSPDGKYLATSSADSYVRIWDATGHLVAMWHGHTGSVNDIYFSRDGQWLLTVGSDRYGRQWPFDTDLSTLVRQSCDRTQTYHDSLNASAAVERLCQKAAQSP
ncbi:TIR domain-containing protein [Halomicronema sp. CCY15110]|uniref:TIR domain-containing protein n=1 Tax=Halomicronema sp. CCY15110 TaxID=2767773 RepID=UPI001950B350|nr:TIR domain-containing protein [Halomicronema sp. CCY15110]